MFSSSLRGGSARLATSPPARHARQMAVHAPHPGEGTAVQLSACSPSAPRLLLPLLSCISISKFAHKSAASAVCRKRRHRQQSWPLQTKHVVSSISVIMMDRPAARCHARWRQFFGHVHSCQNSLLSSLLPRPLIPLASSGAELNTADHHHARDAAHTCMHHAVLEISRGEAHSHPSPCSCAGKRRPPRVRCTLPAGGACQQARARPFYPREKSQPVSVCCVCACASPAVAARKAPHKKK